MKKISLFTLALASGLAVFAQDQDHKPLRTPMETKTRFGLKGGVNLATFNVNSEGYANPSLAPNTNLKTTFQFGGLVNIPLGGALHLQPELVYHGAGSKMSEKSTSGTGSTTYNYEEDLHYLSVPIMFQFIPNNGFFVEAGPQLSYMIDAKQKGRSAISTQEETDLDPVRDNFDIGIGVGLGYLSRIGLGLDARYTFGLRNIVKDANGELKNKIISIGLVYQFGAYK